MWPICVQRVGFARIGVHECARMPACRFALALYIIYIRASANAQWAGAQIAVLHSEMRSPGKETSRKCLIFRNKAVTLHRICAKYNSFNQLTYYESIRNRFHFNSRFV